MPFLPEEKPIRAAFVADAATDAGIMVDPCLAGVGMYMYGSFGTIVLATAGGTSPAYVGDFIIDLYAGRACFVYNTHNVVLVLSIVCTFYSTCGIFG